MKNLVMLVIGITLLSGIAMAQDSLYIYQDGLIVNQIAASEIDSIVFYKVDPIIVYGNLTDIDNNNYKTVTIGSQTWMAENLRVTKYNDGTAIPIVTDSAAWSTLTTGAYCNYNNTVNTDTIKTYGRLYNWFAANTSKLCPTGWHVPNDSEWTTLENFVINAKPLASTVGWVDAGSFAIAGSAGDTPSTNNKSGFTAIPAGYRNWIATYNDLGTNASWWSTTENPSFPVVYAEVISIYDWYSSPENGGREKATGLSVRCLKN